MLIKAILTGGVLCGLTGAIVYFGAEGVEARDVDTVETVAVDEMALAGAADVAVGDVDDMASDKAAYSDAADMAVAEVEAQDPPAKTSEPKTKWLDQYLKKSKPKAKPEADMKSETGMKSEPNMKSMENMAVEDMVVEDMAVKDPAVEVKDVPNVLVEKRIVGQSGSAQATGTYVISKSGRTETLDVNEDIDIQILKEELGLDADKNIQIRIIKKMDDGKSMTVLDTKTQRSTDYALILAEAKKLLVTDMRNQAFLEVIDHAVDEGSIAQAADIIEELSTPELRDTARARIGTGLARQGNTTAAFAVLEEIEIDELSAPIRLEIITALMATKQERGDFTIQR